MHIVKDAISFWKETWRDNKFLFWCEAIGTILGMLAAGILNLCVANPPMLCVLILYTISAILLCYAAHERHSSFIMILMAFYTITSTCGLISLLF